MRVRRAGRADRRSPLAPERDRRRRIVAAGLLLLVTFSILAAGSIHGSAVTLGPGVIFQPSASWSNISFTTQRTFTTIRVDPTGVSFDGVRLGVVKTPASEPRLEVLVSAWDPFVTVVDGTALRFTGDAPAGSVMFLSLSNVTPSREYLLDVDGAQRDRRFSDVDGFVSFEWPNWTAHDFVLRFGDETGTPPPPEPLAADFAFVPGSPSAGESVSFSATASGGRPPYAFAWDFDDGSTGSGASVAHSFAVAGVYAVRLAVTDTGGQSLEVTHAVDVSSLPPPPPTLLANFTFAPASPATGESVGFTAAVSGGTPPYVIRFDFGDGDFAGGASVTHVYQLAGTFTVVLSVDDSAGGTVGASAPVTVTQGEPPPPTGNVTAAFEYVVVDRTVTFIDRSVSDVALPITTRFWAFGDGATSEDESPVHTYALPGFLATYTAVLVACDADNHCGSTSRTITLYNWTWIVMTIISVAAMGTLVAILLRRRKARRRRREDTERPDLP
jgi:PKD repeat protein